MFFLRPVAKKPGTSFAKLSVVFRGEVQWPLKLSNRHLMKCTREELEQTVGWVNQESVRDRDAGVPQSRGCRLGRDLEAERQQKVSVTDISYKPFNCALSFCWGQGSVSLWRVWPSSWELSNSKNVSKRCWNMVISLPCQCSHRGRNGKRLHRNRVKRYAKFIRSDDI